MAKQRPGVSPTRSAPVASPLQDPYYHRRRLLVGCCVLPSTLPSKVNDPPVDLIFSSINHFPPHDKQPSSPHVPTRPPLFFNVTPNVNADSYRLIVMSWPNGPLRLRPPPSISMGAISAPQTRGSKAARAHPGDGGEDISLRL